MSRNDRPKLHEMDVGMVLGALQVDMTGLMAMRSEYKDTFEKAAALSPDPVTELAENLVCGTLGRGLEP